MTDERRSVLYLIAAAALFSTGGLAIKSSSLDGFAISGFRSLVSGLFLAAAMPQCLRLISWRVLLAGLPYAATLTLYTIANTYTTAANTIFLQDTAPLYVLCLSPLLLKERIQRDDILLMFAIAGGMVLFFLFPESPAKTAPNPALGNGLAAAAGVSWALTIVALRGLAREHPDASLAAVIVGNVFAALIALPWMVASSPVINDWYIVGYLGVFQIGVAYLFVTRGLSGVSALRASLLLLVEPVLTPVWVWLWLGEVPSPWAIAGGFVILAATAMHTVRQSV